MPTLFSMVNETENRNRILERCKFRFWLVHWIDPRSIEHNYACSYACQLAHQFSIVLLTGNNMTHSKTANYSALVQLATTAATVVLDLARSPKATVYL